MSRGTAAGRPPHTAPVETKDSLDQGSVGMAQAASSSALVTGLFSPPAGYSVTRIRGGAESDVEDID